MCVVCRDLYAHMMPAPADTNYSVCSSHSGLQSVVLLPACQSLQQVEAEPGVFHGTFSVFSAPPLGWLPAQWSHKRQFPDLMWHHSAALQWCIPSSPQRLPSPLHIFTTRKKMV